MHKNKLNLIQFKILLFLVFSFVISCNNSQPNEEVSTKKKDTISKTPYINPDRKEINKEPIASYSEKTDNPLNDWYFKVQLFETDKTFEYLIKLQFEEIRGEDTLKLPNFGRTPEPQIKKGDEKYSCIIGFLDKEDKFREYKKVYVKDNHLKITAIRHYGVRVVDQ